MKLREAVEKAIKGSGGTVPIKRNDDNDQLRIDPTDVTAQEFHDPNVRFVMEENSRKQKLEEEERQRQKLLEEEEKARQEAEEKARQEAEEDRVRQEAEEKARQEAEERRKQEAELKAQQEEEDRARREAEEAASRIKRESTIAVSSLAARLQMNIDLSAEKSNGHRKVYGKVELLKYVSFNFFPLPFFLGLFDRYYFECYRFRIYRFRDWAICCERPSDLPDMLVNSSASNTNRRGSSQWVREPNRSFPSTQENGRGDHTNRRQSSTSSVNALNKDNVSTPAEQWTRGMVRNPEYLIALNRNHLQITNYVPP